MKLNLNSKWSVLDGGRTVIDVLETVMNQNHLSIPWTDEYPKPNGIDYHFNRSGGKMISPFLMSFGGEVLTESERQSIARVIVARYYKNWAKEYDTLNQSYNMLENFNGIESESFSTTETQKTKTTDTGNTHQSIYQDSDTSETTGGSVSATKTSSEQNSATRTADTKNTNSQHEHNKIRTTDDNNADKMSDQYTGDLFHERHTKSDGIRDIYGFNTAEVNGVPSEREESNSYSDNTTTHRGSEREHDKTSGLHDESAEKNNVSHETAVTTDTNTGSVSTQETDSTTTSETKGGEGKNHDYGNASSSQQGTSDTEHHNVTQRDLHRHGNLGVTTSQQMIESERELWFWDFCEYVYECIDKVLTCPYYV